MSAPVAPTKEVLDLITKEKADFIEKQVGEMYDFVLESREILTKEAHTTLQWLFAILIGSSGYLITLLAKHFEPHTFDLKTIWWVLIPLALSAATAAVEAYRLIRDALQAKNLFPKETRQKT